MVLWLDFLEIVETCKHVGFREGVVQEGMKLWLSELWLSFVPEDNLH